MIAVTDCESFTEKKPYYLQSLNLTAKSIKLRSNSRHFISVTALYVKNKDITYRIYGIGHWIIAFVYLSNISNLSMFHRATRLHTMILFRHPIFMFVKKMTSPFVQHSVTNLYVYSKHGNI